MEKKILLTLLQNFNKTSEVLLELTKSFLKLYINFVLLVHSSIFLLTMQNFFLGIAKKFNNTFVVNSNKMSIDPYLNEKLCWANQIIVDSTKHFPGSMWNKAINSVF